MFKMPRSLLFWIIFLVVSATLSLAMFDFIPGVDTSSRSDYSLPINSNSFDLDDTCLNELRKQMNLEKRASLVYKQMAFHFGSIPVTRPGFAKLFEKNYEEETEHFDKFIKYISLRGAHIGSFNISMPTKIKWDRALEAVEDAIELEHFVTNEIYRIHRIAEKSCKDIHLMDFLETDFISEQISAINKLMKLATLLKSVGDQGYGEYLIDRDLFEGKLKLEEL